MNPRRDFFILLAYSALALALTFPLISNFSTHVAGVETDAPTLAWNLWWVKYSIFNLRVSPLATDYLFYPVGIDLVAYTLTLFNGLLSLPIQFTTNLIAANNALVIFSLTLSAFGMYLLARDRLRRARLDERGALFAGALYGLGSYHLNYVALGRPELVANQWMPFYFFYLIRALESPRRALKSGAMAGLFFALTAWTEISLAAFLIVLTALYLGWRVYEMRRPPVEFSRVSPRSVLIFFAALAFVALIALAPLWLDIIADVDRFGDYWTLNAPRTPILSADLFGFFLPASINPLLGRLTQNLPFQTINYSFAVFIPLALTIWSVARFRAARAWGALAFIFALLMLGPALSIFGAMTSLPMPFALAQQIPILKATRFPIRFNALFVMTLALAASYGAAELARRARETNRAKILPPSQ
ncbi:MAG: hypothetical protein HY070_04945 [Chloroflexi bacterium]|nr:hypothetical protein [Chloroflexota bacterium]